MGAPPFGSIKCRNCKGTGLDPHIDRDCEICGGDGWLTPGRQKDLTEQQTLPVDDGPVYETEK